MITLKLKKIYYNGVLHLVERKREQEFWEGMPELGHSTEGTFEDIA
jgi:hypothetical protein